MKRTSLYIFQGESAPLRLPAGAHANITLRVSINDCLASDQFTRMLVFFSGQTTWVRPWLQAKWHGMVVVLAWLWSFRSKKRKQVNQSDRSDNGCWHTYKTIRLLLLAPVYCLAYCHAVVCLWVCLSVPDSFFCYSKSVRLSIRLSVRPLRCGIGWKRLNVSS